RTDPPVFVRVWKAPMMMPSRLFSRLVVYNTINPAFDNGTGKRVLFQFSGVRNDTVRWDDHPRKN
ncbi:MAG: hypothetical protein ACYC9S_12375, partial [Leptospirales bacterium]